MGMEARLPTGQRPIWRQGLAIIDGNSAGKALLESEILALV